MSCISGLNHLNEHDKKEIMEEISTFLSAKGWIDGVALVKRMSEVLNYPIEPRTEKYMNQALEFRKRGRNG